MSMSDEHRQALRCHHVAIVQDLCFTEEFLSVLMQERILTIEMKERIEAKETRQDKARYLMVQIVPSSGDRAYAVFIRALVESHQDHIAQLVDAEMTMRFIDDRDKSVEQTQTTTSKTPIREITSAVEFHFQPEFHLQQEQEWYSALFERDTADLGVEMKRMPPERLKTIEEMMKSHRAYHLQNQGGLFGRAVIINNIEYRYLNPRVGSDADCRILEETFRKLHLETESHKDLTAQQIRDVIKAEVSSDKLENYSMFILVILAHGAENRVYGIDGEENRDRREACGTVDIEEITVSFSAVNCPGLAGKPKLFLIQACQGGKDMISIMKEIAQARNSPDAASANSQTNSSQVTASDGIGESPNPDVALGEVPRLHIPEVADILVAYSTAPGYKSWRHAKYGSWFIRCLVFVINSCAAEEHLIDILTQVAYIISDFKVRQGRTFCVQVPQIVSTLRKKVFFMP